MHSGRRARPGGVIRQGLDRSYITQHISGFMRYGSKPHHTLRCCWIEGEAKPWFSGMLLRLLMIVLGPLLGAPARYMSQTETPSESKPVLLHRWRARKARSSTTARYEPVGGQRSVTRDRRGGFAGLWFGGPAFSRALQDGFADAFKGGGTGGRPYEPAL
ncbi:hypothetical protein L226DRAFT_559984 [Lentinus tigrinus ALCF2SS1-7]|uniref:uncharacterized protein n=1 Tax=Lentinus tigrinus ALCF2SS1-7 TaxID=1328758 RepID=UPI001165E480|nr:hypothetical protein L226DRAFT_559984 [Lentinus tigrinus ALCF2SS1-7]